VATPHEYDGTKMIQAVPTHQPTKRFTDFACLADSSHSVGNNHKTMF
jgi:hypothetical protein